MLTGTPLDLTPFGDVLGWIGNTVVLAWLAAAAWLAFSRAAKRNTPREKWIAAGKVLIVMIGIPVALIGWRAYGAWREREAFRARYAVAEALFKKRCETAGEFIYKTVPDVKGVVWMKWRDGRTNHGNQFELDDPIGKACYDEECMDFLLRPSAHKAPDKLGPDGKPARGYRFVEARDTRDGLLRRFWLERPSKGAAPNSNATSFSATGSFPTDELGNLEMHKDVINEMTFRYGIRWDDLSTHEDRENWIAGSSLSVVDLQTNEVLASRVRYALDKDLGSSAGFRSPWAFALRNACPPFPTVPGGGSKIIRSGTDDYDFVSKVLIPLKGD